MLSYHEAAAWFALGRRWRYVDLAFSLKKSKGAERIYAVKQFMELASMLSLPLEKQFVSLTHDQKKFVAALPDIFSRLKTTILLKSGEHAAFLFQAGAVYLDKILKTHRDRKSLEEAVEQLHIALERFKAPPKEEKLILKEYRELCRSSKLTTEDELDLAQRIGDLLARGASARIGIPVGEEVLPNTIPISESRRIVLPKRLVGFRSEIESFLKKHPYDVNVFMMMPFRDATQKLRTQLRSLCSKYKLNLVIADENRIVENELNSNVLACLLSARYGIAVFTRPEARQVINPNVAYELGLMHRDDKVCLILKDRNLKSLPTDLIGHLYVDYSPKDHQELISHVESWIQERIL